MDFVEKNATSIRLTCADQFAADKKLFEEKRPNSKLNKRLRNVNQFNQKELDEAMIFELLDHVSEKDIQTNRKEFTGEQKKSEELTEDPTKKSGSENTGDNSANGSKKETGTGDANNSKNITKATGGNKDQKKSKGDRKKSSKKSRGKGRKKR